MKFLAKEESGRVRELLMLTGGQRSFTLLSMQGIFTYSDLNIQDLIKKDILQKIVNSGRSINYELINIL